MIEEHWNRSVEKSYNNIPKVRDYISFSDLGKDYISRYYKMKGEPPTNPYDERTLRIFDAGKVMEFIVLRALTMAGLLNQKQTFAEIPATERSLKCLGYLDCTIGGHADWDKAKERILKHLAEYKLSLDDQLLEQKAVQIIDGLRQTYPKGVVEEMLVEVKSINSMAFWAHKNRDAQGRFLGYPHNKLQLYGYLKAAKLNKGLLLYISKDDFVLQEVGVINGDLTLEQAFTEDTELMTAYYRNDEVPPKEEEVVYNPQKDTFELNWQVERSVYLTKIYGYKDKVDFEDRNHTLLLDINRAYKHLKEDKVKEADKEVIETFKLKGYLK